MNLMGSFYPSQFSERAQHFRISSHPCLMPLVVFYQPLTPKTSIGVPKSFKQYKRSLYEYIIDTLTSLTDSLTYQNSKVLPVVVETYNFAYLQV